MYITLCIHLPRFCITIERGMFVWTLVFAPQCRVCPFSLVYIDFNVIEDLDSEWRNSADGSDPKSWYITQLNFLPVNHHGTRRPHKKKSKHPSLRGNFARGLCPFWNLGRSKRSFSICQEAFSDRLELFSSFDCWGAIDATLQPFGNLATVRTRQCGAAAAVLCGSWTLVSGLGLLSVVCKKLIFIIDWSIRKRGCIIRGIASCQVGQVCGSQIYGPTSPFGHSWCGGGLWGREGTIWASWLRDRRGRNSVLWKLNPPPCYWPRSGSVEVYYSDVMQYLAHFGMKEISRAS